MNKQRLREMEEANRRISLRAQREGAPAPDKGVWVLKAEPSVAALLRGSTTPFLSRHWGAHWV